MKTRSAPWLVMLLAGLSVFGLGLADWFTGYELSFFVFYFLPVAAVAWYVGLGVSLAFALVCGLVWYGADLLSGHTHSYEVFAVWNGGIRVASFLLVGWSMSRIRTLLDRERKSAETLRAALSEIKVLETFLPICAQCKKIRNDQGEWQQLEVYIGQHSNTQFSHGYCPTCVERVQKEAGLTD